MKKVVVKFLVLIICFLNIQSICIAEPADAVNFKPLDKDLTASINNLSISHIAPKKLYRLIRLNLGVEHCYVAQMQTILDLIWTEPNGKLILTTLMDSNTPINITKENEKAYMYRYHYSNSNYSSVVVNIPFTYIEKFNNANLGGLERLTALQVILHELGHAFINIKNPNDVNSIEEELGVSMIGFNIATKIITTKYLDKSQTEFYSMNCLSWLLKDDHKKLPVYSGFNYSIRKLGIAMPYPQVYMNIPAMYRKLLAEGRISPVPTFGAGIK